MKKIKIAALALISALCLASCNKTLIDTHYEFNYAYVNIAGHYIIEGPVESWTDYSDGDQIQVTINGVTYLAHSSNVTLIYNPEAEFYECPQCGYSYSTQFNVCPHCHTER